MNVAGMKNFAILYPRVPYGETFTHLFWDEIEKRKGEVRGIESYTTEDTTFAPQVKSLVAQLGGRLVSAYVTTGQYDVALTIEMPDGDAMTKFVVSLTSSGNARTTTVRAFTPEEFGKLAAEAP